jgi:hypothetical protein
MKTALIALVVAASMIVTLAADKPAGIPDNYTLLYEQNFEQPSALADLVVSDAKLWRLSPDGANTALELFSPTATAADREKAAPQNTKTSYKPKFRSPLGIALVADRVFGDFILDADVQSTVKPYGHQDVCLFYGFQSPTEFYYTHIAVAADPNAHNIFIVNNAARKNIAQETTKGITWGQREWHKVRIERKTSDGTIKVFFDDLTKPIMRAEDKTFPRGLIGFGSFDDLGRYDNVRIWGPAMETKKTEFFNRPQP